MLILSRKIGEQIQIGPDVTVTVVRVTPNSIRLGVSAPTGVPVVRSEIRPAPEPAVREQAWHPSDAGEWA